MKLKIISLLSLLVFGSLFLNNLVLAEGASAPSSSANVISLENPIGSEKDAGLFGPVMKIVNGLLGIIGALALVAFVYGGYNWLISAGNAEKVKTGTTTMIWAILGLFLIFSSYAILKLITDALGGR